MADVFPPSNLPGRATAWGRSIEGTIRAQEKDLAQFESSVNNWSRFTGGQLSVMARNIEEVYSRSTESVRLETISVSGDATSEPFPRANRTVTFSPTPKSRNGFVTVSGDVTNSASSFQRVYVYLLSGEDVIGGAWAQPFSPISTPMEWQNNAPIFVTGAISIPENVSPSVTVRVVRASDQFSPEFSTVSLVNPVVTLTRSP